MQAAGVYSFLILVWADTRDFTSEASAIDRARLHRQAHNLLSQWLLEAKSLQHNWPKWSL